MTLEERERLANEAANYWADEYRKLKNHTKGWRRFVGIFYDGLATGFGIAVVIWVFILFAPR